LSGWSFGLHGSCPQVAQIRHRPTGALILWQPCSVIEIILHDEHLASNGRLVCSMRRVRVNNLSPVHASG
jgi:hypothetical protein